MIVVSKTNTVRILLEFWIELFSDLDSELLFVRLENEMESTDQQHNEHNDYIIGLVSYQLRVSVWFDLVIDCC